MPKSSRPVINKLIKEFGKKFNISRESKNKFYFDGAYYSPDLVLKKKKNNKIIGIVEIEQGTRKHVIGGAITADYVCKSAHIRPVFVVLGLTSQDVKDYKKRKRLITYYTKSFKKVIIGNFKETVKELKKL
jgi:hypothetical protein